MSLESPSPPQYIPDSAIQIADRIWWVGHKLENDVFQCHSYLIEQGDESVLIDPGSLLTFEHTLKKIEQILPFHSIRYFICHHQDPDIAASLPQIDELIRREDALLVTHWRTRALLKHYNLKKLNFWLVDENAWTLKLEDRTLDFIFTPYAHFPGAFTSFDSSTGVLFSSDLFGGFTEQFQLFTENEDYFEQMKPFHEHYIPSRDILDFAVTSIQKHPVKIIAPQHGSIIGESLVPFILEKLRNLECGIYLFARQNSDVHRLSRLNQTLRDITKIMLLYRDFRDIAGNLLEIVKRELPIKSMEFFTKLEDEQVIHLCTKTNYSPSLFTRKEDIPPALGNSRREWEESHHSRTQTVQPVFCGDAYCLYNENEESIRLLLPLFSPDGGRADSLAILHLNELPSNSQEMDQVIDQIAMPLQVALERESIYQTIDRERKRAYERSIRDPLTGCFTRMYMVDVMTHHCEIHDRHPESPLTAVMVDIDHFKSINDLHGHRTGDEVLRLIAERLQSDVRSSDILVRYGGEEFLVFLIGEAVPSARAFAERLRFNTSSAPFVTADGRTLSITLSAGIASRNPGELLDDFIHRADGALYRAKKQGRNRVCLAE